MGVGMSFKQWFWNMLVAVDQFFNTLLGGDPDETISSRAGKAKAKGHRWGCILCALLDKLQKNHCDMNIESDEGERISKE
jgi:hypothetical protein